MIPQFVPKISTIFHFVEAGSSAKGYNQQAHYTEQRCSKRLSKQGELKTRNLTI